MAQCLDLKLSYYSNNFLVSTVNRSITDMLTFVKECTHTDAENTSCADLRSTTLLQKTLKMLI